MRQKFSVVTRQLVATRANFRCEYCRKPDLTANFSFHIEHIISRQHGGSDHPDNLAYACSYCNWKKGPNIGTILSEGGSIIPLFHPRKDQWFEHFTVEAGAIYPLTEIRKGTIHLLDFNAVERILERKELVEAGVYP